MRKKNYKMFIICFFSFLGLSLFWGVKIYAECDCIRDCNLGSVKPLEKIEPTKTPVTQEEISKQLEERQKEMLKMKQEMQARQEKMLEEMKARDPEGYTRQRTAMEMREQISQIVQAYREKKLDEDTAAQQLVPLVEQNVFEEIKNIDQQIEMAEGYTEQLKKIKQDPSILVQKRIDQMLGKRDADQKPLRIMSMMGL